MPVPKLPSRRAFLRLSALGAVGTVLVAACAPAAPPTPTPPPSKPAEAAKPAAPAAAPKPAAGVPVNLAMWLHYKLGVDFFGDRAKVFGEKHPSLNFSIEFTQVPGAQIEDKFAATLMAGAGAPDMIGAKIQDFPKLLKGGIAEKGLVDLVPRMSDEEKRNYLYREAWSWKGKGYGWPIDMAVTVFYYNKEIFDAAGIDPTRFKLYSDFIAAGQELLTKKGAAITVLDTAGWNQFWALASQNGGGWFNEQGESILDGDRNVEALQLWSDLLTAKIAWPTGDFYGAGTFEAFRSGKVAGIIMAEWYTATLEDNVPDMKGKWRMTPLPRFKEGGSRTGHRGGTSIVLARQSKFPEEAIDFMRFSLMTNDSRAAYFQFHKVVPPWLPARTDSRIAGYEYGYFANQKIYQVMGDVAPEVPSLYTSPFLKETLDITNTEVIAPVAKGERKPAEALKKAAQMVREVIAKG